MGVGFNLPKGTWQYGPVVIEKVRRPVLPPSLPSTAASLLFFLLPFLMTSLSLFSPPSPLLPSSFLPNSLFPSFGNQGEWVDVLFHIGWSTGDDGFIHTFIEGGKERAREMQALTPPEGVRGRTLFYQYTDYLKLGLYRCVEGGRKGRREGGREGER